MHLDTEVDTVDQVLDTMVLFLDNHTLLHNHKVVVKDIQNGLFRKRHTMGLAYQATYSHLHCQSAKLLHCVDRMPKMRNVMEYLLPIQVLHFEEMVFVRT
jgi:hypothetical protein